MGICLILMVPAFLGIMAGQFSNLDAVDHVLDKIGLGYIDRMPSAWDFVLRKEEPAFVRVYLSDGAVVGGVFSTGSFASTTAGRSDIYLEEAWELDTDGKFVQSVAGSAGVWIAPDRISRVEFFEAVEVDDDGTTQS